jgi:hypothetical protein
VLNKIKICLAKGASLAGIVLSLNASNDVRMPKPPPKQEKLKYFLTVEAVIDKRRNCIMFCKCCTTIMGFLHLCASPLIAVYHYVSLIFASTAMAMHHFIITILVALQCNCTNASRCHIILYNNHGIMLPIQQFTNCVSCHHCTP